MNEIADGEIHKINDEYAYILKIGSLVHNDNISELKNDFISKYSEYIYKYDKEKSLNLLYFCLSGDRFPIDDSYEFIHKTKDDMLGVRYSFALKFKRSPNDQLDNE